MKQMIDIQEQQRLTLQVYLDSQKTPAERNCLGQFATPTMLAVDILKYASTLIPDCDAISFLDPAIGTGAFYSSLIKVFPKHRINEALGFEIDPHYGKPALKLWSNSGLVIKTSDFTKEEPSPRFNLVICNPPYVRHHHMQIEDKIRLQSHTYNLSGIKISGLAGLYCHFLCISHAWIADNGIAGWLMPSEFMDVNYGRAIKRYLLDKVTLLHIHRFDPNDVQFADALVSSAIVWFRKSPPPNNHSIKFTFGGSLFPQRYRVIFRLMIFLKNPNGLGSHLSISVPRNRLQLFLTFFILSVVLLPVTTVSLYLMLSQSQCVVFLWIFLNRSFLARVI